MRIIYCGDPLNYKKVDPDYEIEYTAAIKAGFKTEIINYEELVYGDNAKNAVKNIKELEKIEYAIFRGWMMTPLEYEKLYNSLLTKNLKLINSPMEFKHCHYLPCVYPIIKEYTPKTVYLKKEKFNEEMDNVWELFNSFDGAVIIKDYVKARKFEWDDAYFIPEVSDLENVKRVVGNFLSRQGIGLNEGLVIRQYVELLYSGIEEDKELPIEYRIFFYKGEIVGIMNSGEIVRTPSDTSEFSQLLTIAKEIKSNFFMLDIGKNKNGEWIITEVGDGQVSSINTETFIEGFYKSLAMMALK